MTQPSMFLTISWSALVLIGCSATPVSQKGTAVEITTERPQNCKILSEVIGS